MKLIYMFLALPFWLHYRCVRRAAPPEHIWSVQRSPKLVTLLEYSDDTGVKAVGVIAWTIIFAVIIPNVVIIISSVSR